MNLLHVVIDSDFKIVDKPETELPGFWVSAAPVILPVVLITSDSILGALLKLEGVRFEGVTFAYQPDRPVLADLSFDSLVLVHSAVSILCGWYPAISAGAEGVAVSRA